MERACPPASIDLRTGPPVPEEVAVSRSLSVLLLWLQPAPRRPGVRRRRRWGVQRLVPESDPGRRWRALRRSLLRRLPLYQWTQFPPFPWEEDHLRWSGDRLDGELLPPGPGQSGA
jgi:hypothetical protein